MCVQVMTLMGDALLTLGYTEEALGCMGQAHNKVAHTHHSLPPLAAFASICRYFSQKRETLALHSVQRETC